MSKSAYEMWNEHRSFLRNRYTQEYLDYMLRVLEQAKKDDDRSTLAKALSACASWMWEAGRLEEALSFYEQRLAPDVWQEDKLEVRCVKEFIKQIKDELKAAER